MDEQKHYILVDNEAYELYDGNGSFYVTKAANPTEPFVNQNSLYCARENDKNFLENFIIPAPAPDTSSSCQISPHLEPIIINDYGTMNYFTQAASDVTIYLNSNNENTFMENIVDHNEYVVGPEGVIDLTKFSASSKRKSSFRSESPEKQLTPDDLDKSVRNVSNEEMDAPEFIDISKLKLSYDANTSIVNRPLKRARQNSCKALTVSLISEESDDEDDEVVFVKEFKANHTETGKNPLDMRRRPSNECEKRLPAPRRNPKRQVQLLKESFDLALKLSDEEIYYGNNKNAYKDYYAENSQRSSRNTGAILNSPDTLTNEDYKEWPIEGLHERPVFNMATKQIEKFDFKPADPANDKLKAPAKKNDSKPTKIVTVKKPGKKGKRKVANKSKKTKKEAPEKGINKEFAALTHETLQEVIKYVSQVKQYNEIRKGKVCDNKTRAESGSLIDDAESLLSVVCSDSMEENLNNAVDLLTDSCILYSLANDVCQKSVAKYLASIKGAQST